MSKYKLILKDYCAVKSAEVQIDGITVLTGVNGCGKSTISRWFYYIAKASVDYVTHFEKEAIDSIDYLLSDMRYLAQSLRLSILQDLTLFQNVSETGKRKVLNKDIMYDLINRYIESVERNIKEENSFGAKKAKLTDAFRIDNIESDDIDVFMNALSEQIKKRYDGIISELHSRVNNRTAENFNKVLSALSGRNGDQLPEEISFYEDDENIIDNKGVRTLFDIRNTIYYQTDWFSFPSDTEKELKTVVGTMPKEAGVIEEYIQKLIGGDVYLKKNEPALLETELFRYKMSNGKEIPLRKAALGIKSLGELLILLRNGHLKRGTLFIIDEPEVHLHPQWIVEYAKIMVMLNKILDVKILISSHNPDMVAAIQSIAMKEETISATRFYYADTDKQSPDLFVFNDLGESIEQIFGSFNIAFKKMEEYGNEE